MMNLATAKAIKTTLIIASGLATIVAGVIEGNVQHLEIANEVAKALKK